MQFMTQIAKLDNQLSFEKQKTKDMEDAINRLNTAISKESAVHTTLETQYAQALEREFKVNAELQAFLAQLEESKKELADLQTLLNNVKRSMANLAKEFEGLSKSIAIKVSYSINIFRKQNWINLNLIA